MKGTYPTIHDLSINQGSSAIRQRPVRLHASDLHPNLPYKCTPLCHRKSEGPHRKRIKKWSVDEHNVLQNAELAGACDVMREHRFSARLSAYQRSIYTRMLYTCCNNISDQLGTTRKRSSFWLTTMTFLLLLIFRHHHNLMTLRGMSRTFLGTALRYAPCQASHTKTFASPWIPDFSTRGVLADATCIKTKRRGRHDQSHGCHNQKTPIIPCPTRCLCA